MNGYNNRTFQGKYYYSQKEFLEVTKSGEKFVTANRHKDKHTYSYFDHANGGLRTPCLHLLDTVAHAPVYAL